MNNIAYETMIDIQAKKCYTCNKYGKCGVLDGKEDCNYQTSIEAKRLSQGANPIFGIK